MFTLIEVPPVKSDTQLQYCGILGLVTPVCMPAVLCSFNLRASRFDIPCRLNDAIFQSFKLSLLNIVLERELVDSFSKLAATNENCSSTYSTHFGGALHFLSSRSFAIYI